MSERPYFSGPLRPGMQTNLTTPSGRADADRARNRALKKLNATGEGLFNFSRTRPTHSGGRQKAVMPADFRQYCEQSPTLSDICARFNITLEIARRFCKEIEYKPRRATNVPTDGTGMSGERYKKMMGAW